METKTIARLYKIACGQVIGDTGSQIAYHLGYALTLRTLNQDETEIRRHIRNAFDLFRKAKYYKIFLKKRHSVC